MFGQRDPMTTGRAFVVLSVVLALLWVAPPARAAEPSARDLAETALRHPNPVAYLEGLSPAEREKVLKEVQRSLTLVVREEPATPAIGSLASSCWSRAANYYYYFGSAVVLHGGQTTTVCVSGGQVSSVSMSNQWRAARLPGWVSTGSTSQTRNVWWEGRGLMTDQWTWSAGFLNPTLCAQVRLNANMVNYLISDSCSLG